MLISIITPCLNRAEFVAEAVESVLNQDYPNIEHIIMDGGSTDGTFEVLKRYSHLKVVSEPDQGLYDAINKGITLSRGEIIGFLNTDDFYASHVFYSAVDEFRINPAIDAVVGGTSLFIDDLARKRRSYFPDPAIKPGELLFRATRGAAIFNAWFFRRNLFRRLGMFDIQYRYAADRDFLIRMALNGAIYSSIPEIFYYYRSHPGSLTFRYADNSETDVVLENLTLSENYLKQRTIDDSSYKKFVIWHSQITSDQSVAAMKKGACKRSISYIRRGIKYNPIWLAIFVERLIYRGVGYIRRRITRYQISRPQDFKGFFKNSKK